MPPPASAVPSTSRSSSSVVAFVDDAGEARLAQLLGPSTTLRRVRTIANLASTLSASGATACVIDPGIVTVDAARELCAVTAAAGVTVVLYGSRARDCAARMLAFAHITQIEILFWNADDERGVLRRAIQRGGGVSAVSALWRALTPHIERLPPDELYPLTSVFGLRSVPLPAAFFARCPRPRRTVERAFGRAGIASVATCLDSVRLAVAWDGMLLEPTLDAVAARFGYGSRSTLDAHFRTFCAHAPRRARRSLSVDGFVARLSELVAGGGPGDGL